MKASSGDIVREKPPENVIDNDKKSLFVRIGMDGNMKSAYIWLQLELEGYSEVGKISIFNGDNDYQTSNVEVRVGNTSYDPFSTFKKQTADISKNPICGVYPDRVRRYKQFDIACNETRYGTFVSLRILEEKASSMNIAEVVVYGKSMYTFFYNSFIFYQNLVKLCLQA